MGRYDKYYSNRKNFLQAINHDDEAFITPVPRSYSFIKPAQVLNFNYPESGVIWGLVVEVERGPGIFVSTRGNKLVCVFKLTNSSPETVNFVLKTIYKDRRLATYSNVINGLSAIFGRNSFRTYNLSKMSSIMEVDIKVERLEDGGQE